MIERLLATLVLLSIDGGQYRGQYNELELSPGNLIPQAKRDALGILIAAKNADPSFLPVSVNGDPNYPVKVEALQYILDHVSPVSAGGLTS